MELTRMPEVEVSEHDAQDIEREQEQAVLDSDPRTGFRTIAIRWGNPQLRTIRQAAEIRGLPYQVYIKNAAWEMAMQDLDRTSRHVVVTVLHYATGAVTVKNVEGLDQQPFSVGACVPREVWLRQLGTLENEGWLLEGDMFKIPDRDFTAQWVISRGSAAAAHPRATAQTGTKAK